MGLHVSRLLRLRQLLCLATLAMIMPAVPAMAQGLPNGVSNLQETYEDWRLTCAMRENRPACLVTQDQSQQNGQRLLTAEFQPQADGRAIINLLLPFGILFDAGVAASIDGQPPLSTLRIRTCLPTGCIAVFAADTAILAKLRAGSRLNLKVITASNSNLDFPISLKGLSAAFDRANALIKQ